jgi:hypothetical protein
MYFQPFPPSAIDAVWGENLMLHGIQLAIRRKFHENPKSTNISNSEFLWRLVDYGFRVGNNIGRVAQIRQQVPEQYQINFDSGVEQRVINPGIEFKPRPEPKPKPKVPAGQPVIPPQPVGQPLPVAA